MLRTLGDELSTMTSWLAAQDDPAQASAATRRFGMLIWETPALRAYQSDMMDQFTSMAAGILAARAGMRADDPEPQVAAAALLSLWRIQYRALPRYLDGVRTPAEVHQAVSADVGRAARLIGSGRGSPAAPRCSWRNPAGRLRRAAGNGRRLGLQVGEGSVRLAGCGAGQNGSRRIWRSRTWPRRTGFPGLV
jgi:MftR C-terminal domain